RDQEEQPQVDDARGGGRQGRPPVRLGPSGIGAAGAAPRSLKELHVSNRHGIIDTIIDNLAPVNRDGHKFIRIAAGLALIFFLVWPPLAWVCVVAALYIAYFFRDP